MTNNYDTIGRLSNQGIAIGSTNYTTSYNYVPGINGSTSTKIQSINNNNGIISYTYDANGNISTITQGGKTINYYYDELNELIREDNPFLGTSGNTIVYTYDSAGNLTNKATYPLTSYDPAGLISSISYQYGDSNWKDKLTNYNGMAIGYDAIGNPTSYNGWTFAWEEGRQLSSMNGNGKTITYKYNDNGIRTSKTVSGVTTNYHLVGDKVTYEDNGTDKIYYTYDSNGQLISMNLNGSEYYYIRNAQGDIIGLFDTTGTQVVSYTYDSWGKLISITGTLASTVGAKNPYRYRGYRYDTETGLYYLQSRYYNPEWGRFINADGILGKTGELLDHNIYAYCKNDPIDLNDKTGYHPAEWDETDTDDGTVIGRFGDKIPYSTGASDGTIYSKVYEEPKTVRKNGAKIKITRMDVIKTTKQVSPFSTAYVTNISVNYSGYIDYSSDVAHTSAGAAVLGMLLYYTVHGSKHGVPDVLDKAKGVLTGGPGIVIGGTAGILTFWSPELNVNAYTDTIYNKDSRDK